MVFQCYLSFVTLEGDYLGVGVVLVWLGLVWLSFLRQGFTI